MRIAISGASGFIGKNISAFFKQKGDEIIPLTRNLFEDSRNTELTILLEKADIVINLAGAPINHRWTESYKKMMYESRVQVTRKLVDVINGLESKPKLFISTSAVGYYPHQGCYDENTSVQGGGFLAELCHEWESEARKISSDVRLAITRFGVVLSDKGGAFKSMTFPMNIKIAGTVGPGNQLIPWIYLQDLMRAMDFIIQHQSLSGLFNFVAPQQIQFKDLIDNTGKYKKCVLKITIPRFFFKLILGEASTFITEGQCVTPRRLLDEGFLYKASTIEEFLKITYK